MKKPIRFLFVASISSVIMLAACAKSSGDTAATSNSSTGECGGTFAEIIFDANGATSGTVPNTICAGIAQNVSIPANPGNLQKAPDAWSGWNTQANGAGATYSGNYTVTGNVRLRLYARWATGYSVTYDGNGQSSGTVPNDTNLYANNTYFVVASNTGNLTKGYSAFENWNTLANGSGTAVGAGTNRLMGSANVVLYAKYKFPNFSGVASSSDGTKLVAVADNSSGTNIGNIWTSVDSGVTWTERATSRRWKCVASSSDGSKLVAGVWDGNIYTSTDSGITWTVRDSSRKWNSVASSADGTKLIAAVNQDGFYLSTDSGVTWNRVVTATNAWTVTTSSDGARLLAGDLSSAGLLRISTDSGANWSNTTGGLGYWTASASSSDGTKLYAIRDQIRTSSDSGANWVARESIRQWASITSSTDGTKAAAIVTNGQIFTSGDSGVTWTARESSRGWTSLASSSDGTKLVAVVSLGQIYTSTDSGVNWTAR
ncbi:MAG: InlB B-repeat-containing protein [Flavobacteriales bacterium]|nr:InlB B-repeat-containing protein [Flavobacteriales bacterium]